MEFNFHNNVVLPTGLRATNIFNVPFYVRNNDFHFNLILNIKKPYS